MSANQNSPHLNCPYWKRVREMLTVWFCHQRAPEIYYLQRILKCGYGSFPEAKMLFSLWKNSRVNSFLEHVYFKTNVIENICRSHSKRNWSQKPGCLSWGGGGRSEYPHKNQKDEESPRLLWEQRQPCMRKEQKNLRELDRSWRPHTPPEPQAKKCLGRR